MSQLVEIKVPDIGDFSNIPVIEICVKVGDTIKLDDALVTLESDKATMDVPSSVAGVVKEIRVALGDRLSEGAVVALVETSATQPVGAAKSEEPKASAPQPAAAVAPTPAPVAAPPAPTVPSLPPGSTSHASPSVRLFARELGVDLTGT